jgi:hypothetical protein
MLQHVGGRGFGFVSTRNPDLRGGCLGYGLRCAGATRLHLAAARHTNEASSMADCSALFVRRLVAVSAAPVVTGNVRSCTGLQDSSVGATAACQDWNPNRCVQCPCTHGCSGNFRWWLLGVSGACLFQPESPCVSTGVAGRQAGVCSRLDRVARPYCYSRGVPEWQVCNLLEAL